MRNKRILAALLSIVMILTQIPASTYADIVPVSNAETTAAVSTNSVSQELQERINVLPSVEDFKNLDQDKQDEIYNEAQNIADEYDKLEKNEQSQIDTGRLNDLFGYFNAQVSLNASYELNASDSFTINADNSLTAKFMVANNNLDMRGWLLCLMEDKPDVNENNELTDKDNAHPYSYSDCKYYFFAESTTATGQVEITWAADAVDQKNSGKTLTEALDEKNWQIVIGPRHYNARWDGSGIGEGTDGIWENCDYYVGPADQVIQRGPAWTFMNDGYPYGKDMSNSSVTLVMDVKGTAPSYQWQSATSKDGEYTDIADATSATYTITSPITGTWYRCVVDGTASKAVETIYPSNPNIGGDKDKDGRYWNRPYNTQYNGPVYWYISNGKMAYMANGSVFDVTGLYTKNSTDYMLCTSYSGYWSLYSNPQSAPNAGNTVSAQLDALRIAFNDEDDYDVIFEADLKDGQKAFSFGCDTQLGNRYTSGDYDDKAALKAIFKNKKFYQVSMIGAASFNTAKDDDPAFVIAPITDNSTFWIGHYRGRQTYSYNVLNTATTGYKTRNIDGKNVVTLLEGIDSGMTMSWLNLESGSSVKFRFGVGSVKDTGAVSGKVDYTNEKITGLDPDTAYEITIDGDDDTKYTITSNSKGEILLAGEDSEGKSYDFVGKNITIAKVSNPDASADLEISGRPNTPQNPSDLDNGSSSQPSVDEKIEIKEMTTDSVTISPIRGQQYAYSKDGTNWTILDDTYRDSNGYYKITGLDAGSNVYIKTRISATANEPASEWSSVTELTLKATIEADITDYIGTYDGEEHSISVTPTNVEDAVIKYSLTSYGTYSTELPMKKDAGSYTVYYRIEKDGYYPLCGSAPIYINKRQLTIHWLDTTFVYDGTEKLPTATIDGVLEADKDNCSLRINLNSSNSAVNAGYYSVVASVSNDNYTIMDYIKEFVIEKADKEKPDVTATAESVFGKKDGTINGLTVDMEYRKVTEEDSDAAANQYTAVTEENLSEGIIFENGTYAVRYKEQTNYKASPDMIVTIAEGKKYTITLPAEDEQIGYTITSDKAEAGWQENVTLTFTLNPGCTRSEDFSITVNGNKIENVSEDGTFTYTIANVEDDITISVTGVSDTVPPTGEIKSGKTGLWNTFIGNITFNYFIKSRQQVTITAVDEGSGVQSVEYYIYTPTAEKKELSLSEVQALVDWTEGTEFYINPADKCVIYAKITDRAGNTAYLSSDGIALDSIVPVIAGITEGETYCKNIEFTASDDNLESVTYQTGNGDIVELQVNSNGKYTLPVEDIVSHNTDIKNISVIATDKAGNAKIINIKAAHEFEEKEVVAPTVLHKGYTEYVCKDCEQIYKSDYESAAGVSGLVPNDKEGLISYRNGAQEILGKDELSPEEEDKDFYTDLVEKINSMLDDIQKAEELIKAIDDMNIPEMTNPTIDDSDKLNEALTKINELLDKDNEETPTQSLTDEQKEKLESLKESISGKLETITKANDELKAVKEGTSTEAGVDTINGIESIQPEDKDKIESVLTKLEALSNQYNDNLTAKQQKNVEDYYQQMLDKLKEAAGKEIDRKLEDTKKQIESLISDTQKKEEALTKAAEEAENAKEAVNNGTTKADVAAKREEGKQAVDAVTGSTDDFRDSVKNNIERIFEDKKTEIENMPDLSDDEKSEAVSELEKGKQQTVESLNNQKTKEEMMDSFEDIQSKYEDTINKLVEKDFSNAKNNAKNEIAKKAEEAKKDIEAMTDLTAEEKEAAMSEVDKKAEAAKSAVEAVTDISMKDEIKSYKESAAEEIKKVQDDAAGKDFSNAKDNAKEEIAKKLEETKKAIEAMPNLTAEEKEAAKKQADEDAKTATDAIDKITDPANKSEVTVNKADVIKKLDSVEDKAANDDLDNLKAAAKSDIDSVAEDAKNAVDAMPDLTTEEKEAKKAEIDKKAEEAKKSVNAVTDPSKKDEVKATKETATEDIRKAQEEALDKDLSNAKDTAKNEIAKKLEETKKAIEAMPNLTAEEKEAAKKQADEDAKTATDAIDKITDPANKSEVTVNKADVIKKLDSVEDKAANNDFDNLKEAAKSDIDSRAEAAKNAIDAMADLTTEEKEIAKAEIDKNAEEAKKAVEAVTDSSKKDEIKSLKESVTEDIRKQQEESSVKNESNAKENVKKAEEAVKKTTVIVGTIKGTTDEEAIKTEIKEELRKSNLEDVDVDVNNYKKTPATLHETGKITGTVEIKSGGTAKTIEIDKELPKLSSFVKYESVVEEGAPKADVSVDEDTLMDNVLGEDECDVLANGGNADITLNIRNKDAEITDSEAAVIAEKLTGNTKVGKYLDISLYLNIVDGNGTSVVTNRKISEAKTMFTIKVNVPEELWAAGDVKRTYQIVRVHNGVAEILDSVYDEVNHTLTFETDRFSTYAIVYSGAEVTNDDTGNNGGNAGSESSNSDITNSEVSEGTGVATADTSSPAGWLLLMASALAGIVMVSKKKKYVK